jgi:hypothetical protein
VHWPRSVSAENRHSELLLRPADEIHRAIGDEDATGDDAGLNVAVSTLPRRNFCTFA